MNIDQLREIFKEKDVIPYVEFLKTDEWKQRREAIVKRDNYKCTNCGARETIEHYDSKLKKKFNFWFGEDEWVITSEGFEVPIPKPILADKSYHLEVHHNIYIINRLPWEYEDDDLSTLCNWCHWDFHKNNTVTVYSEDMINEMKYSPCIRCNGAGWFPEYRNIEGGICFRCRGARFEELLIFKK